MHIQNELTFIKMTRRTVCTEIRQIQIMPDFETGAQNAHHDESKHLEPA